MKNWRKMFLLAAIMAATSAFAVPTFTPVIDGVKDAGWGNVPDISPSSQAQPITFNLDSGLYITDDAANLYFGFWGTPDPWDDAANVHIHLLIDTGTVSGALSACWPPVGVNYAMPNRPEYAIMMQWGDYYVGDTASIGESFVMRYNAGSWSQVEPQIALDAGGSDSWTEIAVPKSRINRPVEGQPINISMWLRPSFWNATSPGGVACLPAQANFPSDNGAVSGRTLTVQQAYMMQVAANDTVRPRIHQVKQIDRTGVEIQFNEPMLEQTLGSSLNYTTFGWPFNGSRYITTQSVGINNFAGFTAGNTYSVLCLPGIRDISSNSIDPAFDSAGWVAPTYADVTFRVIDQSATHDSIEMKGSFNFYHEHDNFWGGGNQIMYDNGTHGDDVAGDHIFTLLWPLVPSPNTYEWGCTDELDSWLVVEGNQTFNIADATPITVTYTIPSLTIQDVTVTFRCDMRCVFDPIDSVTVAGVFDNWTGALMTDANSDDVYELTIIIPAGSSRAQEYKYRRHADLGQTYYEDPMPNRAFDITDEQTVYDFGIQLFANYECVPRIQEVRQIDQTGVEIRFDKEMSEPALSILANYTMFGWAASSIRYTSPYVVAFEYPTGFAPNVTYSVLCGQNITAVDNTPIHLDYDSAGWIAPDYADVTFEVTDQTATHDSLRIRGSWNWFHEYDVAWSGGITWLYDDGTHGDVTAGDHIFTTVWVLVPSATDYAWGVEDELGNWLLDGPDQTFNLPDNNDVTVTYTITQAQATTADATVTFLCDMQCQPAGYDAVNVAGTFSSFTPVAMTDADLNGQYEIAVVIPAGSPSLQQYLFLKHTVEGDVAEPIAIRQFTILPGQTEVNLGNKFFGDELCQPTNLTVYRVGNSIELRWSGPDRAAYQVWERDVPDQIAELGAILGTTSAKSYSYSPITPLKAFYQVKTVMP
ncbi:hypothetical protein IT157_09650 [bacterium]|nr:hypothetical protein [bacterium]